MIRTVALGLILALTLPALAQEKPVVLSRFGVGKTGWSNAAELAGAAAKGNPAAKAQWGEMLLRGDEVEKNVPLGLQFLEEAARLGEANAAFRIGMLLDDGEFLVRNRARAVDYFKAAAAGGVAEAFYNVGAAYAGAHGVKRDYAEGLAWLILATKHGTDREAEIAVRTRINRLRHPEWIADGERRATELEAQLRKASVVYLLPPVEPLQFASTPKK